MNANGYLRVSVLGGLLMSLAGALPAWAQPAAQVSPNPKVLARCAVEVRRLQAHGQQEMAAELQRQLDLFQRDPSVHQAVLEETAARLTQARTAFERYYARLVAEGQREGAERMRRLFEISLTGAPAGADTAVERSGPTPTAAPSAP